MIAGREYIVRENLESYARGVAYAVLKTGDHRRLSSPKHFVLHRRLRGKAGNDRSGVCCPRSHRNSGWPVAAVWANRGPAPSDGASTQRVGSTYFPLH